jgi:hypothetical protein
MLGTLTWLHAKPRGLSGPVTLLPLLPLARAEWQQLLTWMSDLNSPTPLKLHLQLQQRRWVATRLRRRRRCCMGR